MSRFKRSEPFGKAGLTVAILALVLAMVGGAYAAGALSGKQKKEVEKIAKKFAGKPGAPGTTGPAGTPGTNGKNGTNGANGKEGSPWTDGGTLPSGSTETGVFGLSQTSAETVPLGIHIPISFSIPLAAPIENAPECGEAGHPSCVVHVFEGGEGLTIPAGCTGTIVGTGGSQEVTELGAEPGNFCVYLRAASEVTAAKLIPLIPEGRFESGAGRVGTELTTGSSPAGTAAAGFWAVTAP